MWTVRDSNGQPPDDLLALLTTLCRPLSYALPASLSYALPVLLSSPASFKSAGLVPDPWLLYLPLARLLRGNVTAPASYTKQTPWTHLAYSNLRWSFVSPGKLLCLGSCAASPLGATACPFTTAVSPLHSCWRTSPLRLSAELGFFRCTQPRSPSGTNLAHSRGYIILFLLLLRLIILTLFLCCFNSQKAIKAFLAITSYFWGQKIVASCFTRMNQFFGNINPIGIYSYL